MRASVKRIGFGVILWAIPYALAIPLLSLQQSEPFVFKAIMVLTGSIVQAALAAVYFSGIEKHYFREAFYVCATWLLVNWMLDYAALLPFTGQTVSRYFMEIGIEYVGGMAAILAIGYLLEKKAAKQPGV